MQFEDMEKSDIVKIKDCFYYFEVKNKGYMESRLLGTALRYLKLIPSEAEVAKCLETMNLKKQGEISLPQFIKAACSMWYAAPRLLEAKLWDAFMVHDKEIKGFLSPEHFKDILTKIGSEPIPDKEADKFIKNFITPARRIEYTYVISAFMSMK